MNLVDASPVLALVERLFGPPLGNAERQVAGVERELGGRLPLVLRGTYLGAGRMPRVWDARSRGGWQLRGLGGLHVDEAMLVVAEEQQGAVEWGIEWIARDDDPVLFERADDEWVATSVRIGAFLRGLVLFHASTCIFEWEDGCDVPRARAEALVKKWEHVALRLPFVELDLYVRGSAALRIDWSDDSGTVFVGGRDDVDVRACASTLRVDLPEAWPDDVF